MNKQDRQNKSTKENEERRVRERKGEVLVSHQPEPALGHWDSWKILCCTETQGAHRLSVGQEGHARSCRPAYFRTPHLSLQLRRPSF